MPGGRAQKGVETREKEFLRTWRQWGRSGAGRHSKEAVEFMKYAARVLPTRCGQSEVFGQKASARFGTVAPRAVTLSFDEADLWRFLEIEWYWGRGEDA